MVNGRPQAACTRRPPTGMVGGEQHGGALEDIAQASSRCCSWKATTTACSARRAETANCRPWPIGSASRSPRYPYQFPQRDVDASHPDMSLTAIAASSAAAACVLPRPGRQACVPVRRPRHDKKSCGQRRGPARRYALSCTDKAADVCPVGAHLRNAVGFRRTDRPAALRSSSRSDPTSRQPARAQPWRGSAMANPRSPPLLWPAASDATCPSWISTTGS